MRLNELRHRVAKAFFENGVEPFVFETDVIIQSVLKLDKTGLIANLENEVEEESRLKIMSLLQKRLEGYPLQYLAGVWEFYGREFYVGEGVLIPRADTETIVDVAKSLFDNTFKIKALDLCSGSGCLGITLEKELNAEFHALEKSEIAYDYLVRNIELNESGVIPKLCDVLEDESTEGFGKLDLIVSNPPYIKTSEIPTLSKEVSYEPVMALDGDEDGLKFYRGIAKVWRKTLKRGGYIIFEIGSTQAKQVREILVDNGYCNITMVRDLAKNPRVVYARRL